MKIVGLAVLVLAVSAASAGASFPGRNGKLASVVERDGGWNTLVLFDPDGTHRRTFRPGGQIKDPAFSADGRRVVFISGIRRDGAFMESIKILNLQSRRARVVFAFPNEPKWQEENAVPNFSPDGKHIVYAHYKDIWRIRADGTKRHRITTNPRVDSDPVWSPNGRVIAFISNRDGVRNVYTMRPDGSRPRRLAPSRGQQFWPDFSPSGRSLVFQLGEKLFTVRVDGTRRRLLYSAPGRSRIYRAHWSPNGRVVATTTGQCYTRFFDVTTKRQVDSAPPGRECLRPYDWQPLPRRR